MHDQTDKKVRERRIGGSDSRGSEVYRNNGFRVGFFNVSYYFNEELICKEVFGFLYQRKFGKDILNLVSNLNSLIKNFIILLGIRF